MPPLPCGSPTVGTESADVRKNLVPVDVYLCSDCAHIQLLDIVDPAFQYNEYRWTTSISLGLTEHFEQLADYVVNDLRVASGGLAVEIGSNDGTVLKFLKQRGLNVCGIDPARDIAEKATQQGVRTIAEFFSVELAKRLRSEGGPADVIIANNVLANLYEVNELIEGVKELLKDDGVFVFETQYGVDVFERFLLDTIYHEHISYFCIKPLIRLFQRHDMELFDVQRLPTKGGSIRCSVQLRGGRHPVLPVVEELVKYEEQNYFDKERPYREFADKHARLRDELQGLIDQYVGANQTLAGYGASVGTITLMHCFNLQKRLDCIFDDKPMHSQLFGPDYEIPVVRSEEVYTRKPAVTIVFAWRYINAIKHRHERYLKSGGRFLVPIPNVTFHTFAG